MREEFGLVPVSLRIDIFMLTPVFVLTSSEWNVASKLDKKCLLPIVIRAGMISTKPLLPLAKDEGFQAYQTCDPRLEPP